MVDPVKTMVGVIERELATVSGATLFPGLGADAADRFRAVFGLEPTSGLEAFLVAHDGGRLSAESRLLAFAEAATRFQELSTAGQRGLWPFLEHAGRLFALDAEGAGSDGEWPAVEVTERGVDRVGTSFLRFLHVLGAELLAADTLGAVITPGGPVVRTKALAEECCRRDPGLADHWLELAQLQEEAGEGTIVDTTLDAAVRAATPPTPSLLFAVGMRASLHQDWAAAARAFEDAIALEPLTTRDDDARLDAAAAAYVLASERGDAGALASCRRVLADGVAATAAFWRVEALHAMGADAADALLPEVKLRVDLGLRIVSALVPEDADLPRLRDPRTATNPMTIAGLRSLRRARESLETGRPEEAIRAGKEATEQLPELGSAWALLAEAMNAAHERGALDAARKATTQNPMLVEGWRERGEAEIEAGEFSAAERSFRKVVELDPTYGLGFAKLAQVLLEQERTLEALEAIAAAADRGGDPFFIAAIRGDVYAEMERHAEAAAAYDDALKIDPEDHWALHQAAVEHGHAGHLVRATELFEAAMKNDRDGCHQTLIDFGDLLRRSGRIGDAVRLYRKAVAAVPGDLEWKQTLKEAERELLAAPN
jgi:tetratricopeptide (TPR) repeat protein